MTQSLTRLVIASAAVLAVSVAAGSAPASASGRQAGANQEKIATTTTQFSIYAPPPLSSGLHGAAEGTITWFNRSANVSGHMTTGAFSTSVTFYFEAYAGSTKVDSTTRTARGTDSAWQSFNFTLDASDLVGGFDRIKMQAKDNDAPLVGDPLNCYRTADCANHS